MLAARGKYPRKKRKKKIGRKTKSIHKKLSNNRNNIILISGTETVLFCHSFFPFDLRVLKLYKAYWKMKRFFFFQELNLPVTSRAGFLSLGRLEWLKSPFVPLNFCNESFSSRFFFFLFVSRSSSLLFDSTAPAAPMVLTKAPISFSLFFIYLFVSLWNRSWACSTANLSCLVSDFIHPCPQTIRILILRF